jgi:hypothetical protein
MHGVVPSSFRGARQRLIPALEHRAPQVVGGIRPGVLRTDGPHPRHVQPPQLGDLLEPGRGLVEALAGIRREIDQFDPRALDLAAGRLRDAAALELEVVVGMPDQLLPALDERAQGVTPYSAR